MNRKLVTVRTVGEVRPIVGADRVEVATVDGWTVVVKVKEFSAGDLAVFFEIDSFLPAADSRWKFLEDAFIQWNGHAGYRVKSAKIRGQMSQGILLPLNDVPEVVKIIVDLEGKHGKKEAAELLSSMSFADTLNVKKWERLDGIEGGNGKLLRALPSFISRTDQERVQNLPGVFKKYQDEVFQETTKMDGSSMTVYYLREDSVMLELLPQINPEREPTAASVGGRFGVCSRNVNIVEASESKGGNFWAVARKNDLARKMAELNRSIAIQGELCGSSIQANFEGFPVGFHDFFLFSVWDIEKQKYMQPKEAEELAAQLGLKHVPVIGYRRLGNIATSVKEILARAEGKGLNGRKREGIVLKQVDGDFSFKAISNSYLLKHGE
ncbi:hypothetical protein H072_6241 [Dactylellina haptotyla CBS 200.50]|uniref:RNA ligase domain-containing protein n=1 Tax=Dactylellina haptotyla (strain CBS 200.50) TaxID=1284197 RepID=S8BKM5_DACHA|nr:hypothetical protein H072_6241 [Dactylellina haptotyla CBS 200.50]